MTRITETELTEAEAKARAATPGPWKAEERTTASWRMSGWVWAGGSDFHPGKSVCLLDENKVRSDDGSVVEFEATAAHIAQMNPAFTLRLLAELKWQRGMLERAKFYVGVDLVNYSIDEAEEWLSDLQAGPKGEG